MADVKDLSRERIAELVAHLSGSLGTGEALNHSDTMALLSMASRAALADEELAQRRAYYAGCQSVGLSARWCPACGDCTCPLDGDLDTPDCPLHGTRSIHCAPPIEDDVAARSLIDQEGKANETA